MTSLLKPGILVSLKTQLQGGVYYNRQDLAVDVPAPVEGEAGAAATQAAISRWETTKVIDDVEEHKRATKARSAASSLIRAVTTATSFGLLCPESREVDLDKVIAEARKIADEHNATAQSTQVSVFVLKGRIASSDEEAARAIANEVSGLLRQMEEGIRKVDVTAIRDAANRARKMGAVLDEAQAKQLSEAVTSAREAARLIVKRVENGGEAAEVVLGELDTKAISSARFAFLDLEAGAAPAGATMPAVELGRTAALDLPEGEAAPAVASGPAVQLDLEIPEPPAVEAEPEPEVDASESFGVPEDALRRAGGGLGCYYDLEMEL
jgi:hypothetical protein